MSFRVFPRRSIGNSPNRNSRRAQLGAEQLEGREVPAVNLASINSTNFANNQPLFIPVTNTATVNGTTAYTATSSNSSVSVSVLPAGQTLRLDMSGVDKTGTAFTGTLTIRLFADAAPLAVQRITDLANSGFYNGKTFFRVLDDFVIQGGSSDNTGSGANPSGVNPIPDEFDAGFTFNSPGILAFANAGDDANGTQIFISDIDTPLSGRPQFLNFNHTVFGQLTSGFDTFTKIIQGTVTTNPASGEKSLPTNAAKITAASIINDNANGVLRIVANSGFTGNADISVTGNDADNSAKSTSFTVTAAADTVNDRPFLPNLSAVTVASGSSTVTTLPTVNIDNDPANLVYRVGVPGNLLGTPANVTTSIDSTTGKLTITPVGSFTGAVDLLIGVRDNLDRGGRGIDDPGNFDTQSLRVNITAAGPVALTVTSSSITPQQSRTVLLTANVTGANTANGTVRFFDGTTELGNTKVLDGRALLTTSFNTLGTRAIRAEFTPVSGTTVTATSPNTNVTVASGTAPVALTSGNVAAGSAPIVVARRADGTEAFRVNVFPGSAGSPEFTGGVRVAVADVTGDGQQDIIAVPGFGGGPVIQIINGADGKVIRTQLIFEDTFRGGLYVDAKDALGRGYAQILVGAGLTGGPRVSLFDAVTGTVVLNYFAYDSTLRGGVTVSLSDLRGGEQYQIITGAGSGGGPAISVYNPGQGNSGTVPQQLGSFFAGDTSDRTGRRVGAGPIRSNGVRNIQVFDFDESDSSANDFDPLTNGIFPG
jgi:cyclophilin family peptidyl-prolyl cis-trans isomerase